MTSFNRISSCPLIVPAGCFRPWLFMALMLAPYASAQAHSYNLDELLAFPFSCLLQLEFSPSGAGGDHDASPLRARSSGQRVLLNVLNQKAVPDKTVFLAGDSRFAISPPGLTEYQQDTLYLPSDSRRAV
jgi:hypothetical protein